MPLSFAAWEGAQQKHARRVRVRRFCFWLGALARLMNVQHPPSDETLVRLGPGEAQSLAEAEPSFDWPVGWPRRLCVLEMASCSRGAILCIVLA